MGKAAKSKQIRRLASQLPVVELEKSVTNYMRGKDLLAYINSDETEKKILHDKVYLVKRKVPVVVNHYKKMKQNFYKAGMSGAAVYARSVQKYVTNENRS